MDASRRGFLTQAAGLAAAGTTIALAGSVAPADAAIVPSVPIDDTLDPFLVEMSEDLTRSAVKAHQAVSEHRRRDRALKQWERRNPRPGYVMPGDEGYSPTAVSDWSQRQLYVMSQLKFGRAGRLRNEAVNAYIAAAVEFAAIKATNQAELLFKVGAAMLRDTQDGVIARSILWDVARLVPPSVAV